MDEEQDEDLKRAIALSLQDSSQSDGAVHDPETGPAACHAKMGPIASPMPDHAAAVAPLGIAGLDRRAMEQERLTRLAQRNSTSMKRQRSITPPTISRPSKASKIVDLTMESASKPRTARAAGMTKGEPVPDQEHASTSTIGHHSLQGRLFKTWAFGHARSGQDIKFEEVIEKHTLQTALLSAFQWDYEWLFPKLNTQKTKFLFVVQAKGEDQRSQTEKDFATLGSNVKVCMPPMEGGAFCMHSKLMLLFHPNKLRVVIPSANLVPYDWGETGVMENTVWLIDLPRLSEGSEGTESRIDDKSNRSSFIQELSFFLEKQKIPTNVIRGLDNFDWSATAPYAFVSSIASTLYGSDVAKSGIAGLSASVNRLGLTTTSTQVDMCASSVGALKPDQVLNLYASCSGAFSAAGLHPRLANSPTTAAATVDGSFRLYFPTKDYVANSTGGIQNGGTIWFKRDYYTRSAFPSQIMREYRSTRQGLLSHCKMLFVRGLSVPSTSAPPSIFDASAAKTSASKDHSGKQMAWIYAGSANCSEAAWGSVTTEKKAGSNKGRKKIFCRNWECGVVIPVLGGPGQSDFSHSIPSIAIAKERDPEETESEDEGDAMEVPGWDVFRHVIDGPFQVPAPAMGNQEPWYVEEHLYPGRLEKGQANSAEE